MLSRRKFLQGFGLAGACTMLPLGGWGVAYAGAQAVDEKLVVIMLRGAVDGLSVVVPYREAAYYDKRPNIAIAPPSTSGGVLDLDGQFGLNPALQSMMPLWQNKTLAFVHAAGSPATTRSHFEAQDILETASTQNFSAPQGWMNRLAAQLPNNGAPSRSVSFGNVLPRIFMGPENVATMPTGGGGINDKAFQNQKVQDVLSKLYGGHPELNALMKQGIDSRAELASDMQDPKMTKEMEEANKGAPPVDGFVKQARALATMLSRDANIQLVFMDVGGWDTHVNQGNADLNSRGQLAQKLEKLGDALAALAGGLGNNLNKVSVVVMSEFGRTAAENGNHGTDHGHGNVMWLMGGGVNGGKVYGRWPGLSAASLYEGRDLAVTTDFRSVLGKTMERHFKLSTTAMAHVLPDYRADGGLSGLYS